MTNYSNIKLIHKELLINAGLILGKLIIWNRF